MGAHEGTKEGQVKGDLQEDRLQGQDKGQVKPGLQEDGKNGQEREARRGLVRGPLLGKGLCSAPPR